MLRNRPTVQSMELWADIAEDQSYSFDNVLPFFKKTIEFTPPDNGRRPSNATVQYDEDAFDPAGQPLQVSYSTYAMAFSSWMKRGLEAVGIHETNGFNSGFLNGSQYCASTIRPSDQTRSSSESAFLCSSTKHLGLLKIYKGTMAKSILFDSQKRATGVEVKTSALKYTLSARKEVIVSAGALQSPQLLMVSGMGPADSLRDHGIDVISNLPGVGQNMWDHVFFGPTYQVALETFTKLAAEPLFLLDQLQQYIAKHTGMLASPVTDFLAFEKIPEHLRSGFSAGVEKELAGFPDDWPEIEVCIQQLVEETAFLTGLVSLS